MTPLLTTEEAVRRLRSDSQYAALVRDTYLDVDVVGAAKRFADSGEWAAVLALLAGQVRGARVLDLGAGNGMASRAFVLGGAKEVVAVEPDASDDVGRGALARVCADLPVQTVSAFAESLPLPDAAFDLVYARQVLHHTADLPQALRECHRVLRPGGLFLACREHVADNPRELAEFLAAHPVHQLTGGENAYSLAQYEGAVTGAGLELVRTLGPWDSVLNAYPHVRTDAEIATLPERLAAARFGALGRIAARTPGLRALVRRRLFRPRPGRLYSFLARKP